MSTTEDRIESLENQLRVQQSQVRRQRRWNIALGAVVVVGGLMAAVARPIFPDSLTSRVLRAQCVELVDADGKVTGWLGDPVEAERPFGLFLLDSKADPLVGITTLGERGSVVLGSKAQPICLSLGVTDLGDGMARFYRESGKPYAAIINQPASGAGLIIQNSEGKSVAQVTSKPEFGGGGCIAIGTASGDPRGGMVVTPDGGGSLMLTDKRGATRRLFP